LGTTNSNNLVTRIGIRISYPGGPKTNKGRALFLSFNLYINLINFFEIIFETHAPVLVIIFRISGFQDLDFFMV
jgi:hypothetical protein